MKPYMYAEIVKAVLVSQLPSGTRIYHCHLACGHTEFRQIQRGLTLARRIKCHYCAAISA